MRTCQCYWNHSQEPLSRNRSQSNVNPKPAERAFSLSQTPHTARVRHTLEYDRTTHGHVVHAKCEHCLHRQPSSTNVTTDASTKCVVPVMKSEQHKRTPAARVLCAQKPFEYRHAQTFTREYWLSCAASSWPPRI